MAETPHLLHHGDMVQPATGPIIDQVRPVAVDNMTADARLCSKAHSDPGVVPHPPSGVRNLTPVSGDVTSKAASLSLPVIYINLTLI